MLSIRSTAAMTRALELPLDPTLCALLLRRMSQLTEYDQHDLCDLAHFLVVQEGDTAIEVEAELGFSVLINFVDGRRFGDADFEPSWEWLEDHGGWFELVFVLTDDGFGWVLFIEDRAGVDAGLLDLCHAYRIKRTD
jgi:hypothetical protein